VAQIFREIPCPTTIVLPSRCLDRPVGCESSVMPRNAVVSLDETNESVTYDVIVLPMEILLCGGRPSSRLVEKA